MDLILKIKELNSNIDKIEQLADDLIDSLDSKVKKIDHLKEQIQDKVEKIDKIIKNYNADS